LEEFTWKLRPIIEMSVNFFTFDTLSTYSIGFKVEASVSYGKVPVVVGSLDIGTPSVESYENWNWD
jgi:hypothetical protein